MPFLFAALLTGIIITAMATGEAHRLIKLYLDSRIKKYFHLENIERLKNGYPPIGIEDKAKDIRISGVIDMTGNSGDQPESRHPN
jgi:hypothetical protein